MQPNRNQYWSVLIALLALRLIIGFHFFNEGVTKVRDGDFTCASFLSQAKGPFAEQFAELLDDHDGHQRLCISTDETNTEIDTGPTFAIWEDFVDRVSNANSFDDQQLSQFKIVLNQSRKYLTGFLSANEPEILAWVAGEERLSGFKRDGASSSSTVQQVESLNEQLNAIKGDRNKVAAPWLAEVETTWDELEARINRIAGTEGSDDLTNLSRPFDEAWSKQGIIDRFLPWFDVTIGVLLVVGLFSRLAAIAGVGLLLGVVATQPFWVMGAQNTYYQWIEIFGLLVLFATAAGRFGGLDYFTSRFFSRPTATSVNEE